MCFFLDDSDFTKYRPFLYIRGLRFTFCCTVIVSTYSTRTLTVRLTIARPRLLRRRRLFLLFEEAIVAGCRGVFAAAAQREAFRSPLFRFHKKSRT